MAFLIGGCRCITINPRRLPDGFLPSPSARNSRFKPIAPIPAWRPHETSFAFAPVWFWPGRAAGGAECFPGAPWRALDGTPAKSPRPRRRRSRGLSWKLLSDRRGEAQTAYEIRAASTPAGLAAGSGDFWSSGKVISDQSVLVPWGGTALGSRAQVFWQVRVWDKDGAPSAWSDPASFELGLLNPAADWKGQWITADLPRYDIEQAALAKADWINAGSAANQAAAARLSWNCRRTRRSCGATWTPRPTASSRSTSTATPTLQGSTSHTAPFHADFGRAVGPRQKHHRARRGSAVRLPARGGRNAIAARVAWLIWPTAHTWNSTPTILGAPPSADSHRWIWRRSIAWTSWFAPDAADSAWAAATVLGPYARKFGGRPAPAAPSGRAATCGKLSPSKGRSRKARLYSTALGVYEASLNGRRVNDHQLDPGFTDYSKRVMVQTTDVTALLQPGAECPRRAAGRRLVCRPRSGWMGLCQYKQVSDASARSTPSLKSPTPTAPPTSIATDNSWKGGPGEVVGSDEQLGEVIDARQAAPLGLGGHSMMPHGPPRSVEAPRGHRPRPAARAARAPVAGTDPEENHPRGQRAGWWTSGRTWSGTSASPRAGRPAPPSTSPMREMLNAGRHALQRKPPHRPFRSTPSR